MERTRDSTDSAERPSNPPEPSLKSDPFSAHSSNPLLSQDSPIGESGIVTTLLVIAPLAIHLIGSVAIAVALIHVLDGRHFYLERQPRVKLADGTIQSGQLGQRNILQSDVTTMVSLVLMLLRWVTAAWAGPLCWRVIVLLAERNGLRRRDIRWVTSYGILPTATYFLHPRNLLLGLALVFTLAPYPGSPILTGSISWIPSSSTVELSSHPRISLTGPAAPRERIEDGSAVLQPTFSTDVVINLNTAWSQNIDNQIFKRVVPAAATLDINSTVESVLVPYFTVSRVEWFSYEAISQHIYDKLEAIKADDQYSRSFQTFVEQLGQPGAAGLVMNTTNFYPLTDPPTLAVLVNVANRHLVYSDGCDSTTTFLPNHTTIPSFRLNRLFSGSKLYLQGCFAYANVTFYAGFGSCRNCRVGAYSTVQNDTELEGIKTSGSSKYAVELMREYLPSLTPVKGSLPNLSDGLDTYLKSVLIRSYSALLNTWNDGYTYNNLEPHPNSTYKPAFSTLRAEVDQYRVGAWLALQLSVTLAGLVFISVQLTSKYPFIADTSMVAFDIDSTEVPKPSRSNKDEPREMLRFEPQGDGWKAIVASGRSSRDLE